MTETLFVERVKEFEGYADFFYLDSEGYVTIGIGLMFPNADAVIRSHIQFTSKVDLKAATEREIRDDFHNVKQSGSLDLNGYDRITKLRADSNDLYNLFSSRLKTATYDAKRYYENAKNIDGAIYLTFDSLPENVQYALIDMSYNLGYYKLLKYKNLRRHLMRGEWSEASGQAYRHGIQTSRNNEIAKWISWNI